MEKQLSFSLIKYLSNMITSGRRQQALEWAEQYRDSNPVLVDALYRLNPESQSLAEAEPGSTLPSQKCFVRQFERYGSSRSARYLEHRKGNH